ncbi:MAG: phosphate ABC transporter substrate-binding protein PstS [Microbacteriaceae bacterium]|nr:phosphate ABC transporter substrate-binding protein PstS [Microbacteriaceae bacterium]
MKLTKLGTVGAIVAVGALALAGCAANEGGTPAPTGDSSEAPAVTLSGTIAGSGASSQGSAQTAWITAFQTANPGVTIEYDAAGSGAGREAFIGGGVAYAGTDSALNDDEIAGGFAGCVDDSFIQVPAFIDPIAVVFNIEGVTELNLDAATLAHIFKGDITDWSDPAIAALNDGWSVSGPITAVHRSDDSGTTKNFADYLFQVAPDVWDAKPADPFPYTTGTGAAKTSGVIDAVTNGTNTIGYASASAAGDLATAKIKVGDEFVGFTPEAAAAVVAESPAADNASETNLAIKIDRKTTDPTHYPLVLVSYIVACGEYADAEVAPVVKAYVSYITSEEGQAVAAETGAAPLSAEQIAAVQAVVDTIVAE